MLDLETNISVDMSLNNPLALIKSTFIKVVDYHFINKTFLVLIKHFASCQVLLKKADFPTGHVLLGIHFLYL